MEGESRGRAHLQRAASTTLFAEAAAVAALRFLTLVYSVARTAYAPDRARLGVLEIALWVGVTVAVAGVLVAAAVATRRRQDEAWTGAGVGGRLALVLAWLLNAVLLAWAFHGLVRDHSGAVGTVGWFAAILAGSVVLADAISISVDRRTKR